MRPDDEIDDDDAEDNAIDDDEGRRPMSPVAREKFDVSEFADELEITPPTEEPESEPNKGGKSWRY